ncbi:glycosyltransferase [Cereibacter sphaeroides]|uniref:glycosyltransferase family protein n=1 Tax=Rhodobacterales TaxID=204455 RepID=UPI000BBEF3FF|nr:MULTISPECIES: glycosyltransferase [Paracoccaceae]MCE6960741.1 glycosyltransferase [Cereibacter sphaeroides]MCE6974381.1 glycosyltransferase [Cereibacter sphaeroides]
MSSRSTLIVSTYNMDARPWSGSIWEWCNVVSQIESATVVAPFDRLYRPGAGPRKLSLGTRAELKMRALRGQYVPRMEPATLEQDYDLTLYTCQFVYEIEELDQIRRWRERSGVAAIYLMESWSSTFEANKDRLRLLDRFDHVFVLNGSSREQLARYTSAPITQLSSATDTLLTAPVPRQPPRGVDVCCLGRRDEEVHRRLLELLDPRGLLYIYDVWKAQEVRDGGWASVRRFNADLIRRSRYYLAWDPGDPSAVRELAGGDRVLSTRYFEGAAGGAVVLGSAPDCPEYHSAFDWPDALIPLDRDIGDIIAELDADPARVERIRRANVTNSLRRHDWAHRWKRVLDTLGLPATPAHEQRLQRLAALAAQVERPAAPFDLVGEA